MQNKYYVPDITEFRVGFGYEHLHSINKEWINETVTPNNRLNCFEDYLSTNQIRVKYLDKSDIESFGFEFNKTFQNFIIVTDSNDTIFLNMYSDYNVLIGKDYGMGCKESILFKGIIKNKSELQQVLKMIRVIE